MNQPIAETIPIYLAATLLLIGGEVILKAAQTQRGTIISGKSPYRHASKGKVFMAIAKMRQLPIEHCEDFALGGM